MYQETHSSIRKVISDCALLSLIFILLISGSLSIFNGDTSGKTPEMVKLFLLGVLFLGGMLILYLVIYQIKRIRNFRSDWHIELGGEAIKLETPDNEEVEPFELHSGKIRKLSREAYEDDGVWYKWFIYTKDGVSELKKPFELGPFSEEKIADKINRIYGTEIIEVDINGKISKWNYSLWFRCKALVGSIIGALILASFVIPGFFYLVKVFKDISH